MDRADAVFTIRPGNPAAVGASAAPFEGLDRVLPGEGYAPQVPNDAAYAGLTAGDAHVPLAQVAPDFPDLEWLKVLGQQVLQRSRRTRLGALVGSKDFVDDFTLVKGDTDSAPAGVMAASASSSTARPRAPRFRRFASCTSAAWPT